MWQGPSSPHSDVWLLFVLADLGGVSNPLKCIQYNRMSSLLDAKLYMHYVLNESSKKTKEKFCFEAHKLMAVPSGCSIAISLVHLRKVQLYDTTQLEIVSELG